MNQQTIPCEYIAGGTLLRVCISSILPEIDFNKTLIGISLLVDKANNVCKKFPNPTKSIQAAVCTQHKTSLKG